MHPKTFMTDWIAPLFLVLSLASCGEESNRNEPKVKAAEVDPYAAWFIGVDQDPGRLAELILKGSAEVARLQSDARHAFADRLAPYCARAFFGAIEFGPGALSQLGITMHTVAKGELPLKIGKTYGFDAHLLPALNPGFDPRKLKVGQSLRVLDLRNANLTLEIDATRYRVAIWRTKPGDPGARLLMAYFPVGLGAPESPTPDGVTKIVKRVRDPEWTHPESKRVFPAGHPENVLGGFWMALDPAGLGGRSGIGFHGYTGAPSEHWIEQPASHGCVRMLQAHIGILFDIALEGTKVVISRPAQG